MDFPLSHAVLLNAVCIIGKEAPTTAVLLVTYVLQLHFTTSLTTH